MKKIFYFLTSLIISLLFINNSFAQSGWYQVTSPQTGYDLYGIYPVDINNVVCCKFKTTNGGNNWYQTASSGNYCMFFPNSYTGFRGGNGIVKTTNQGDNWISQTNPGGILAGMYFTDVNSGYACSDYGHVIKTTNGGNNWVLLNTNISSWYNLSSIFFINTNTGFVSGTSYNNDSSIIASTSNGGSTWNIQNFPNYTLFEAIYFINPNTGIVIGMAAYKTTDGGNTWISKSMPNAVCHSMFFSSLSTGYSVGNTILKTTDCGENWFYQNTPSGIAFLESVYFLNDNTGYICGDNGVVLKTIDGGGPPFGIKKISDEVPAKYFLSQNYPNPFNPATKIRYQVIKNSDVKLFIYDVLGRKVAELVNEKQTPGFYEAEWDAKNFPSGIYYNTLTAGNFKDTKKMILVK